MRDTVAEVVRTAQNLVDRLDGADLSCDVCCSDPSDLFAAPLRELREALLTHERLRLAKEGL